MRSYALAFIPRFREFISGLCAAISAEERILRLRFMFGQPDRVTRSCHGGNAKATEQPNMKNIKRLAAVVVLGFSLCELATAQDSQNSAGNTGPAQHHVDPAAMVEHLSEVFPQVAAFDVNKDGKLDDTEKEALGKAIADGKLQLPAHTPPNGVKPTPEQMLNHIAEMYAWVSTYDVNKDGKLDATEKAALKAAIEKGEFVPHGPHAHEGADHQ